MTRMLMYTAPLRPTEWEWHPLPIDVMRVIGTTPKNIESIGCPSRPWTNIVSWVGGCTVVTQTDFPSKNGVLNDGIKDITASDDMCCKLCTDRSGRYKSLVLWCICNLNALHGWILQTVLNDMVFWIFFLDCQAWTRIQRKTQWNKEGECWLRSFVPPGKPCSFCNSGFKAGTSKNPTNVLYACRPCCLNSSLFSMEEDWWLLLVRVLR